jgi:hypothetical protein
MAVGGIAETASAQADERRIERAIRQTTPGEDFRIMIDPELSFSERSVLDFGGSASLSYLHLTDADDNARRLLQPQVTLYGRMIVDGGHRFFGRLQFQYRDYSEGDSFDGDGDDFSDPIHDRYWYELDTRALAQAKDGRTPETNFNLRVGRQFVDWGAGLTLSDVLFAARARFESGPWSFTGLAGFTPTDESFIDFDASRANYNEETERSFYGGQVTYRTETGNEFYGFGLYQDGRNGVEAPRAALGANVDFEYDSIYLGVGSRGTLSESLVYQSEFVYELGEAMSDPLRQFPQTEEEIRAWAARAALTYVPDDDFDSRWELEGILASGDDDRFVSTDTVGGNAPGTDDTGFNGFGFVNTGLAFSPTVSNLALARVGVSGFPFPNSENFRRLQIGGDVFFISKLDADAPVDEATSGSAYLGTETDVYVNYRVTSDLAISARYGAFFPDTAIEGESDVRHFVFFGVTLSF